MQAFGHGVDGTQQRDTALVPNSTANECPIDFENVEWIILQITQRRISCTEVVDTESNPEILDLLEGLRNPLYIIEKDTFGDLDFQKLGRQI
jgi:hypothetical protein